MDWTSITFDWNRARAVLVTAEEGSLSAAARALGMTQPTLGRQVSALEQELGVTLFTRAGKRMELTTAGLHLIDHLRDMAEAATAAAMAASGQSQDVAGLVTITASDLYASELLPPIIAALRLEAPALQIKIVASNALRDLMRREADIAIRHVRPDQPDLTARLICDDAAVLYGAPGLLAPVHAGDAALAALPFIGFDQEDTFRALLAGKGIAVTADSFVAITENSPTQRALCRAGVGVAVLPDWIGDVDPGLVRAMPGADPLLHYPVWLAAHREVHNSRRVRLVFDRLADGIAARLKKTPAE